MKRLLFAFLIVLATVALVGCNASLPATATPATATGSGTGANASPSTGGGTTASGATTTSGSTIPQAPAGSALRKIQDRGKLIVGVKYDVPTFGYLNPTTNQLEGFDVDLARAVARELFGSETAIEFKQAVSKDRIPFLQNDQVDLIASTMTANEERAKEIDFSDTYYVAGQSLLVPKNSDITGIKDLGGKTVATVKGSTSEQNIRQKAPTTNVVLFDSYSEAVQTMDTGRAQAVTTDDIILLGYVKQAPDKYKVVGGQFTKEPYAIGIKKGNTDVVNAVNTVLRKLISSGEWAKIYAKNLPGIQVPAPPPQDWREVYKQQPSS